MQALVVNCSPVYNLGAAKLAGWLASQGHTVTTLSGDPGAAADGYDLVCLSVVFSWDAPVARRIALRVRSHADVWCGGPGMYALAGWWRRETGLELVRGLDWRFERQRGSYPVAYASRGCTVGCSFCIVPRAEGRDFILDWDFQPAPLLCDNNLSALPVEFQEHIVRRYSEAGLAIQDANSGFEPRTFDECTYRRWKPALRGPWRLAFDSLDEAEDVRRALAVLRDVRSRMKRVYILIGNEPMAACYERICKTIEWGGEPHVQPLIALNALEKRPIVRHDWSEGKLLDMARWANRWFWRSIPLREFRPRKREQSLFHSETWLPDIPPARGRSPAWHDTS